MNNILLILSVILIVICIFCLIKFLKVKKVETFRFGDLTQAKTDAINEDTNKIVDGNNNTINDAGEGIIENKNDILSNVQNTNINLNNNKTTIEGIIKNLDVLKNYHTDLDEDTKQRTVLSDYKGKKCKESNLDLSGNVQGVNALKICAYNCNQDDNCISFNYNTKENKCRLSSICSLRNTDDNDDFDLYFKETADPNSPLVDYTLYSNQKCKDTSNTLTHKSNTLKDCAQNCTDNPKCISFDYNKNNKKCRLTTDCYNENSIKESNNYNLYQKKNIIVHPYTRIVDIPCQKKYRIVFHKLYNDFCIDSEGNKAKLKKCDNPGNNDNQTFVYNSNGYLENDKGMCLYYDDTGSGPQHGKPIKLKTCPQDIKANYKWHFKKFNVTPFKGYSIPSLAIVSDLQNTNTKKEYAIDATNGIQWIHHLGLKNGIDNNNSHQLKLIEYNNTNKNNPFFSGWFRDYIYN